LKLFGHFFLFFLRNANGLIHLNCMLSYAKSGTTRTGDWLNGFKNGKTLGEL